MIWLLATYILVGLILGLWMAEYYYWTIRFRPPIDKLDFMFMLRVVLAMTLIWPIIVSWAISDRIKDRYGK